MLCTPSLSRTARAEKSMASRLTIRKAIFSEGESIMIYITGDTHGAFKRLSSNHFSCGSGDYLIMCGDFGGAASHDIGAGILGPECFGF